MVPVVDGGKDLGASITYNGRHKQTLINARIAKAATAALSLARLPTFAKAKLLLHRAVVLPRLLYGSDVALFNKDQIDKIKVQALNTLRPSLSGKRKHRESERKKR